METEKFIAKVPVDDTNGIHEHLKVSKDIDVWVDTAAKATVLFSIEPEARSWGIKSIQVLIINIMIDLVWEVDDEGLNAEEIQTLQNAGGTYFNNGKIEGVVAINSGTTFAGKDWEIKNEVEFKPDGALSLDEIDIDLEKCIITIT